MFPLHDDNPTRITPFVTYGLIGMNVFIFLFEANLPESQLRQFFQLYAIVPRELTRSFGGLPVGQPIPEWSTLITSQFLHGGWWHLISNMIYLWVFGNNIEDQMGHLRYLIFYLVCGTLAGLSQWAISMNSVIPSLGASGAISGVLGAYIIRFPQARVLTLVFLGFFVTTIRISALIIIGIFVIQNLLAGFASLQPSAMTLERGGVAYWAHLGGFFFGMILAPFFGLFNRD
ncbi:MAG: rhomboid family intramembrane serine protease [Nostocaceae cyanobacterium]|nr:rhomboid family intramembrane serine protease [Nostocaceae cyanobacterium]